MPDDFEDIVDAEELIQILTDEYKRRGLVMTIVDGELVFETIDDDQE